MSCKSKPLRYIIPVDAFTAHLREKERHGPPAAQEESSPHGGKKALVLARFWAVWGEVRNRVEQAMVAGGSDGLRNAEIATQDAGAGFLAARIRSPKRTLRATVVGLAKPGWMRMR